MPHVHVLTVPSDLGLLLWGRMRMNRDPSVFKHRGGQNPEDSPTRRGASATDLERLEQRIQSSATATAGRLDQLELQMSRLEPKMDKLLGMLEKR